MWIRALVLGPLLTVVLFAGTLMPASVSAQDATAHEALRKADGYLASLALEGSFRGSVLVGINGKVVFEKGYGFADQEWNARNTPTTKFRIASLTKQFTAACILLLKERGQLSMSDPVSSALDAYLGSSELPWHAPRGERTQSNWSNAAGADRGCRNKAS
jgi:CubicO group peptidase (beta-lactamase class C family)